MRFIGVDGVLTRSLRFISGGSFVNEEEVKNPSKLAEILRLLSRRTEELEARTPKEAIEFEREVPAGGATIALAHNMNGGVRFTIVYWTKVRTGAAYPAAGPALVAHESSTSNNLVLQSYVEGRAVIRVEPAFVGINHNVS